MRNAKVPLEYFWCPYNFLENVTWQLKKNHCKEGGVYKLADQSIQQVLCLICIIYLKNVM